MSLRGTLLAFMASTSLVAAGVIPASYHVSKSHATASDAASTSGVEYYVDKVVDYLALSASTSASPTGYPASAVPAVYSAPTQVAEYLTSSASSASSVSLSTASDHATTSSDEHSTSTAPTETTGYLAAALHEWAATAPRPTLNFLSGADMDPDDIDGQAGVGLGGNELGWGEPSKRDEMTVDYIIPSTKDEVEDLLIFSMTPADPEQLARHGWLEDTLGAKSDEQDHATRDVKDEEIMDLFSAVTGKFLHHVAEEHNEHAEPADRHDKRREIPVEHVDAEEPAAPNHDWLLVDPVVEDVVSEEPASPDHPWLVIDPVRKDNVTKDAAPEPVKPAPKQGVSQIMSNVLAAVAKAPEMFGSVKNMPGPVIAAIDQPATTTLPLSNQARAERIIPTMMPDQPGEVEASVADNTAPAGYRNLLPFPVGLPFSLQEIEENSVPSSTPVAKRDGSSGSPLCAADDELCRSAQGDPAQIDIVTEGHDQPDTRDHPVRCGTGPPPPDLTHVVTWAEINEDLDAIHNDDVTPNAGGLM
ncbi:hypothetical protein TI39_contig354g00161 [Zymoseptoria brevis]|uniref:Uncharacterized protein n=1 Tax=Zymoseptoria brevis TaxID=1047168 RepID=A0A0F4GTY5_9PEZI|nr:hypothetical protein TI39_contig354g00161 [Zymoseptoria brevis]